MSKVKISEMSDYEIKKYLGNLYRALAVIDDTAEMKIFLGSLISTSEKVMLARRIQIAEKLLAGKSQAEIQLDLRVGNSTIMFVEKGLTRMFYRKRDGLAQIKKSKGNKYLPNELFTLDELKSKYPAHFILFGSLWKS